MSPYSLEEARQMDQQPKHTTTETVILGLVALALGAMACITALTIWRPGDNTGAVTQIIAVATMVLSPLVILLQGQRTERKVEQVQANQQYVAEVATAGLEGAKDSARRAKEAAKSVEEKLVSKVDEIKEIVNGRQELLQNRINELEEELRKQRRSER